MYELTYHVMPYPRNILTILDKTKFPEDNKMFSLF